MESCSVGGSDLPVLPAVEYPYQMEEESNGCAIDCTSDINGDGFADAIHGAFSYGETHQGQVRIHLGRESASDFPPLNITGETDHLGLGKVIAAGSDINGDGINDLIVRAYQPEPGQLRFYLGNHLAPEITPAGFGLTDSGDHYELTIAAWVEDPEGESDILSVEMYYQGMPTSIFLDHIPDQHGLYLTQLDLPAEIHISDFLFEIVAKDRSGRISTPWPYLPVTGQAMACGDYDQAIASHWHTAKRRNADTDPVVFTLDTSESHLSGQGGGIMDVKCYVWDPQGLHDIAAVQLCYEDMPTGIFLTDTGESGDPTPNDGFFSCRIPIEPGVPTGNYLFTVRAVDCSGNESEVFPFLSL